VLFRSPQNPKTPSDFTVILRIIIKWECVRVKLE